MNQALRLTLNAEGAQRERLVALQAAFAKACNALSPLVQQTRCWNRVALHHMAYKSLRQQFPNIGSQMACNAIYSVSRTSRIIYQSPNSPFNVQRLGDKPLPLLKFASDAPVYFDRHTLSLRDGEISMYTLDGRMRFKADLSADDELRFRTGKLREIALTASANTFTLNFTFSDAADPTAQDDDKVAQEWPEYVLVEEGATLEALVPAKLHSPAAHHAP